MNNKLFESLTQETQNILVANQNTAKNIYLATRLFALKLSKKIDVDLTDQFISDISDILTSHDCDCNELFQATLQETLSYLETGALEQLDLAEETERLWGETDYTDDKFADKYYELLNIQSDLWEQYNYLDQFYWGEH